jgi:polysaccharide biosynthesis protein PslH
VKILIVSPLDIFPPNTGGMSRTYNMSKYLMRKHQVALVCPHLSFPESNDLPIDLYPLVEPGRLQFVNPRYAIRLSSVIRKIEPDVIISSFIWPMLPLVPARATKRIPIYLDTHNVESERFRRAGNRTWRAMAIYERIALRIADRVFVVSEDDRKKLTALGMPARKATLAPNGYDDERLYPDPAAGAAMRRTLGIADHETLFLYFGHLNYSPNIEGLQYLHRELLPRLDARGLPYRVAVAGRGSAELSARFTHPRLLYAGVVERIEDLINAADAVIAPLLRGGGTRIKIIETIACGRPVVSTTAGAEGLDRAACGSLLRVVDGWDAFACAMTAAGARGPSHVVPHAFREHYAWSAIVDGMGIDG